MHALDMFAFFKIIVYNLHNSISVSRCRKRTSNYKSYKSKHRLTFSIYIIIISLLWVKFRLPIKCEKRPYTRSTYSIIQLLFITQALYLQVLLFRFKFQVFEWSLFFVVFNLLCLLTFFVLHEQSSKFWLVSRYHSVKGFVNIRLLRSLCLLYLLIAGLCHPVKNSGGANGQSF